MVNAIIIVTAILLGGYLAFSRRLSWQRLTSFPSHITCIYGMRSRIRTPVLMRGGHRVDRGDWPQRKPRARPNGHLLLEQSWCILPRQVCDLDHLRAIQARFLR